MLCEVQRTRRVEAEGIDGERNAEGRQMTARRGRPVDADSGGSTTASSQADRQVKSVRASATRHPAGDEMVLLREGELG